MTELGARRAAAALLTASLGVACEGAININEQEAPTQALNTPTPTAWVEGHLVVSPSRYDFGPVGVGCREQTALTLQNQGMTPVRVFGVSVEVGDDVFLMDNRTGTLDFLDTWSLPILYRPTPARDGSYGEVWVQSDDATQDVLKVELLGSVAAGAEGFDRLHQVEALPSDFLWVMDASSSMAEDIDRVLLNFNVFIRGLADEGVNYHMGFVTMDLPNDKGELKGSYGPDGQAWITRDMGASAVDQLISTMSAEANNNDDDTEAGLQAISMALGETGPGGKFEGFIRPDAQLVIVVITDDNDYSDARPSTYRNELLEFKGTEDLIAFHGILASDESEVGSEDNPHGCADSVGEDYLDMIYTFGGEIESVCSADFSGILATLGSYDKAEVTDTFPLSNPPLVEAGIFVEVGNPDGTQMTPVTEGVDWSYSESSNAIIFVQGHLPKAGATVEIRYTDAGACGSP